MTFILISVIISVLISGSFAVFGDECKILDSNGQLVWGPLATQCDNDYTDDICEQDFEGSTIITGTTISRPDFCWKTRDANGNWVVDTGLKATAVLRCPKRCGYCCVSPAFTCENFKIPEGFTTEIQKICNEVTNDKCLYSVENRPIYAKFCPKPCGFCLLNSCIDAVPSCSQDPSVCTSPAMKSFAAQYCQHTCRYCTQCPDVRNNCASLKDTVCAIPNQYVVKHTCGDTCGIC